ncbi:MAG: hypothetical protein A4E60_02350 [Syntrophorhabdus sp. PtaB.Bin047]|nr:MAG: hypothetical protein A4E60_02350 [Syntrophorhabdus sp. PtaB.Bin047]
MSKTTYVDGNPAEGIPGTIVTADFLNTVNNHHHTGRDIDGEGALAYAADTGEANAYIAALSPALDAYITGMPVCFKVGNANTGASTIDINDLGAKTIKKNGNEELTVGDILAGQIVTVVYDGTNFQIMGVTKFDETKLRLSVRDATRNLVVQNNASNPNHQVDISADEIILQDSDGNPLRITSLSMTADITGSGAGGLDTGSEAISTWYHLWAIARADGTKSVIFSTSATAPTLPTGYTYKAYTGAWYNGTDGHLKAAYQRGTRVVLAELRPEVTGGTATSYTSFAILVPSTARIWHGHVAVYANNGIGCAFVATDGSGLGSAPLTGYDTSDGTAFQVANHCVIQTAQTLYYRIQTSGYATTGANIYTGGWEY